MTDTTASQRALIAARSVTAERGGDRKSLSREPQTTCADVAKRYLVSRRAVQAAKKLISTGRDDLVAQVEQGTLSINKALDMALNDHGGENVLYIITNPAINGWVKVGMTNQPETRISTLNTGSPFDYEIAHQLPLTSGIQDKDLHKTLTNAGIEKRREWFKVAANDALELLTA